MQPLLTRKFNGETYSFYLREDISWTTHQLMKWIVCETPENSFGYPDYVILGTRHISDKAGYIIGTEPYAYTFHRHLQPWILKKIEDILIKLTIQYADIGFDIVAIEAA